MLRGVVRRLPTSQIEHVFLLPAKSNRTDRPRNPCQMATQPVLSSVSRVLVSLVLLSNLDSCVGRTSSSPAGRQDIAASSSPLRPVRNGGVGSPVPGSLLFTCIGDGGAYGGTARNERSRIRRSTSDSRQRAGTIGVNRRAGLSSFWAGYLAHYWHTCCLKTPRNRTTAHR